MRLKKILYPGQNGDLDFQNGARVTFHYKASYSFPWNSVGRSIAVSVSLVGELGNQSLTYFVVEISRVPI